MNNKETVDKYIIRHTKVDMYYSGRDGQWVWSNRSIDIKIFPTEADVIEIANCYTEKQLLEVVPFDYFMKRTKKHIEQGLKGEQG